MMGLAGCKQELASDLAPSASAASTASLPPATAADPCPPLRLALPAPATIDGLDPPLVDIEDPSTALARFF
jgi:hypothetical protein